MRIIENTLEPEWSEECLPYDAAGGEIKLRKLPAQVERWTGRILAWVTNHGAADLSHAIERVESMSLDWWGVQIREWRCDTLGDHFAQFRPSEWAEVDAAEPEPEYEAGE